MINMALRLFKTIVLLVVALGIAHAEKPAKIPVAFGKWTGPHAGSFKSAVRSGIAQGCVVVKPEKARVIIEGEVTATDEKRIKVLVVLKSPRTHEIAESREYTFAKPNVSAGMSKKMGREVTEMAGRAPE